MEDNYLKYENRLFLISKIIFDSNTPEFASEREALAQP